MAQDKEHEIRDELASNSKMLIRLARYQLSKCVNDELFDELNGELQAQMLAVVLADYLMDYKAEAFVEEYMKFILKKEDEPHLATGVYLYCNWRVWATYQKDKQLARKYQAICDRIDDYIFDHWNKSHISYFVKATD